MNQEKEKGKAENACGSFRKELLAGGPARLKLVGACDSILSHPNIAERSRTVVGVARPQDAQRARPTAQSGSESTV
jgi:hypothetical protein